MPFLIEFWSQNGAKMPPQIVPKSSKSRSWGCLGLRDGPKMLQKSLRDPIWTIFAPFWTDLGSNLHSFCIEIDPFLHWIIKVLAQFAFGGRCQVTPDTWHMTHDPWHITHDTWTQHAISTANINSVSSANINSEHINQSPGLAGLAKRLQFDLETCDVLRR